MSARSKILTRCIHYIPISTVWNDTMFMVAPCWSWGIRRKDSVTDKLCSNNCRALSAHYPFFQIVVVSFIASFDPPEMLDCNRPG